MNHTDIMIRLNAALNGIDACYDAIGKAHGLTFNALMAVYVIDESEAVTQKHLCDRLRLPKSTVHSLLANLIENESVRLVEGGNRKEKYIAVTQAGRAFFDQIRRDTERMERNALEALGEEACTALLATAERLAHLLREETQRALPGREGAHGR